MSNWQKTFKKLDKATGQAIRTALDEITLEIIEAKKELEGLQASMAQAELDAVTDQQSGELARLQEQKQELQARIRGLTLAREKMQSALPAAEQVEAKERLAQVQKELDKLAKDKAREKELLMQALAEASLHAWRLHGGTWRNPESIFGNLNWNDIHYNQSYRACCPDEPGQNLAQSHKQLVQEREDLKRRAG